MNTPRGYYPTDAMQGHTVYFSKRIHFFMNQCMVMGIYASKAEVMRAALKEFIANFDGFLEKLPVENAATPVRMQHGIIQELRGDFWCKLEVPK